MKRIPKNGLVGLAALREAASGSFQEIMELIQAALRDRLKMEGDEDVWPWVRALFPDNVVVEWDGRLWRYAYTMSGDKTLALGNPVEVTEKFEPIREARDVPQPGDVFLEGVGERGSGRWRIRAIRAGVSGNGNFYPDAVLREAVPLFDGARVFVKSDEEHLAGRGKDVRNLIGGLSEPAFVEGRQADAGEIQATLQLIEPEGPVAVKLREAWDRGLTRLFGFSIDALGPARRVTRGGRQLREARKISKVQSVDLIVEPGAGGEVINLLEAKRETVMDREEIIALIEAVRPDLLKGKKTDELGDDELKALLREAAKPAGRANPDPAPAGISREELDETVRMVEARADMRVAIAESKLPDAAKKRLRMRFDEAERFTEAEVAQAIKDEAEYLAQFTESGTVRGLGDDIRVEPGESRFEKVEQMLEAFFDPAHEDHRHARSFRECYVAITGDKRVTGRLDACDQALLRESLGSADFASVLGDSITRRMIADYNTPSVYDIWRRIATIGNAVDFRTQERTRFGGYGDLPIVAQGAPYLGVASPTDEKATYAVQKRGGTEDVTLEMIKNDDAGAIRRIPMKLSRAAKRTLSKFVLDFVKDNPVIYDGIALFHASHGNLGSAALDATQLAAGRLAMLKQTEKDSGDRLDIGPRSIMVAVDGEEAAVDLFRRNTNNDQTFINSLTLDVLPVWYWIDANDWALAADPNDIPTIEVGFLDGDEEPALFVQDNPTVGSMFTHDKLTWKIRHIYGGNVLDFRGLWKAVVA